MRPDLTQLIETGLKIANVRQSVIANNIANLNSPGYQKRVVHFEQALADALAEGPKADTPVEIAATGPVVPGGSNVVLEEEIGDMLHNDAAYKTYLRLMSKTLKQMEIATQDHS